VTRRSRWCCQIENRTTLHLLKVSLISGQVVIDGFSGTRPLSTPIRLHGRRERAKGFRMTSYSFSKYGAIEKSYRIVRGVRVRKSAMLLLARVHLRVSPPRTALAYSPVPASGRTRLCWLSTIWPLWRLAGHGTRYWIGI
jgi:hypothetical protein